MAAGCRRPCFFGTFSTLAQCDPDSICFLLPGSERFLINSLTAIIYVSLHCWLLVGLETIENRRRRPPCAAAANFMWQRALIYPLYFLLLGGIFSRIIQTMCYPSFIVAAFGLCLMESLATEFGVTALILAGRTLVFRRAIGKSSAFFDRRSRS